MNQPNRPTRKTPPWTLKTNYLYNNCDSSSYVWNSTRKNIFKQNFTKSELNTRPSNTSRLQKRLVPKSQEHALETFKNGLKTHIQTPVKFDLFTLRRIQHHLTTRMRDPDSKYELSLQGPKIFSKSGSWCGTDGCQKWVLDDARTWSQTFFLTFFWLTGFG
jgi:hypothetical protein